MVWRLGLDLSQPHVQAFADRARIDCEHVFELRCPLYWGLDIEDGGLTDAPMMMGRIAVPRDPAPD